MSLSSISSAPCGLCGASGAFDTPNGPRCLSCHTRDLASVSPITGEQRGQSCTFSAAEAEKVRTDPASIEHVIFDLRARLDAVEAQLADLRAWRTHSLTVTRAIRRAVQSWPGPFIARDIFGLLSRARRNGSPQLRRLTFSQVTQRLMRLEKIGAIRATARGAGRHPNIYEFLSGVDLGAGAPRGKHHAATSGLICAARRAATDLDCDFNLEDIRAWLTAHSIPHARELASTHLNGLARAGEIEIVRARDRHARLPQLYRVTHRYGADGSKLTARESAWREFTRTLPTSGVSPASFSGPTGKSED